MVAYLYVSAMVQILINCAMSELKVTFEISTIAEVSYGYQIGSQRTRSFVDCNTACTMLVTCRSVTYSATSRRCYLNGWAVPTTLLTCASEACDNQDTLRYAIKSGVCLTSIRYECTYDADCVDSGSECRDGICKCVAGLHHDLNTCSCLTECEVYGDTYQMELDTRIPKYNLGKLYGLTRSECLEHCIAETEFTCRSVEYKEGAYCHLQTVTSYEVSPEVVDGDATLFTRDCAFDID